MSQLVPTTKSRLLARLVQRSERGMTTAEYAVGTVAVVLFGGVVAKCVQEDWVQELIKLVIDAIVKIILSILSGS